MGGGTWTRCVERALAEKSQESVLLLVEGPAGSGKSHFVDRLVRSLGATAPSCVRVSFSAVGTHDSAAADSDGPAGRTRERWAERVEREDPALLIAEDIQLAGGEARAELRRFVGRRRPGQAAVVTYRPEELTEPGLALGNAVAYQPWLMVHRVLVAPLDPAETVRCAERILGAGRCREDMLSRLHDRTGGNAQAVSDILRALRDLGGGQGPIAASDVDAVGVPVRLSELVLSHTSTMADEHRVVVWAAAVLGEAAGAGELAAVAGLPREAGNSALVAALACGVLEERGERLYGFRIPMAAEAVYAQVPGPVREQLHHRVARILANRRPVPWSALALHNRRSGRRRGWLRAVERAAQEYESTGSHREAVPLLQEALASPDVTGALRARLAPMLARSANAALRSDETVRVLRQIVEDWTLPVEVRGEIRVDLGLLLSNQLGDDVQARKEMTRAIEELERSPVVAARVMVGLALPFWPGSSLAEDLAWLRRAEDAASRTEEVTVRTAVAADGMAAVLSIGDTEGWERLAALPRDSEDPECRRHVARGLCNAAYAALWLGHYGRAAELSADSLGVSARIDAPFLDLSTHGTKLVIDWAMGRWAGLGARAEAYVHETADMPLPALDANLVLGLLALARGDSGQVEALLRGSTTMPAHELTLPVMAATSGALVRLALSRQDVDAAVAEALAAWERLRSKSVWAWAADLAPWAVKALLRSGDAGAASGLAEELAHGIQGRDAPAAAAALGWCRAQIQQHDGDLRGALARYRAAAAAYAGLPSPYPSALVSEDAAQCALDAGIDAEAAVGELTACAQQLSDLGALWDAARVRARMRAHRPVRAGRPGYGDQLSPREREVAELAGQGLSNREIATTLHLSPRTVEQHVARAMYKLRVHSRQQLVMRHGDA